MYLFLKKGWLYFLVSACCICAFIISESIIREKIIEKEIAYTSHAASEVYMAWGVNYLQMPSKEFWPANSYGKDGLVYTKMEKTGNRFTVKISLPYNTILNYWMVQRKDENGIEINIWDAGGTDRTYFNISFTNDGIFKPGYFIFLAGLLPLLLFYSREREKKINNKNIDNIFKLSNYIPQFDSIRAIAVIMVIVHHWFSKNAILNFLPNGAIGVNIFFVLSGFLITGILLKAKKQVESQKLKRASVFKNFYVRRTLRIFPIYYLLLFIFWVINDPAIKESGFYYFTYTSNYLFYSQQFFSAHLAHLWSLAVEEQFYLIWPWLIIWVNKNFLPYLISLFLIIGISSNYIFTDHGWWNQIFTPSCFDAFAIGAFLSYLLVYRQDIIEKIQPLYKKIFYAVLTIFFLNIFGYSFLPDRTIHALLAAVILYYCLFKNSNKIVNSIFNNKWLIRLGKVSYGVYLYHLFIPELWLWINKKFEIWNIDLFYNKATPEVLKPVWLFIQHFSFLMLMTILSWKLIEKPINNLKRKFENKPSNWKQRETALESSISNIKEQLSEVRK